MAAGRDPISVQFDAAAARLLRSAYLAQGKWTPMWLTPPDLAWRGWALRNGIDLSGTDRWGEVRWARAFKRSVYYLHKWYFYETTGLELGRRRNVPNRSKAIRAWSPPARRDPVTGRYAVRIMVVQGGSAAERAVAKKRPARRYTEDDVYRSTLADRDW